MLCLFIQCFKKETLRHVITTQKMKTWNIQRKDLTMQKKMWYLEPRSSTHSINHTTCVQPSSHPGNLLWDVPCWYLQYIIIYIYSCINLWLYSFGLGIIPSELCVSKALQICDNHTTITIRTALWASGFVQTFFRICPHEECVMLLSTGKTRVRLDFGVSPQSVDTTVCPKSGDHGMVSG